MFLFYDDTYIQNLVLETSQQMLSYTSLPQKNHHMKKINRKTIDTSHIYIFTLPSKITTIESCIPALSLTHSPLVFFPENLTLPLINLISF
jgi:hypothetical protein